MRRDLLTKLYTGLPEMERTPAREIPLSSGVRLLRSRPPNCSMERKSSAGYARLGLRFAPPRARCASLRLARCARGSAHLARH